MLKQCRRRELGGHHAFYPAPAIKRNPHSTPQLFFQKCVTVVGFVSRILTTTEKHHGFGTVVRNAFDARSPWERIPNTNLLYEL